ncbi:MAG: hypothetical protein RBS88_08235 [Spongiibacteraceae bacterium]|nr:hypothetical protein [Spongiibacteraceae bacterium]
MRTETALGAEIRRHLLSAASVYMGLLGLAFILFPLQAGSGAVPADASLALIAYLRVLAGPFLGIAVLDWLSRHAPYSPAMRAVLLGNAVGFSTVALMDLIGVATGDARSVASLFLIVHLLFAVAFVAVWLRSGQGH